VTADGPLSTAHLPRPDPTRGVFETLLVVNGRAIELDAHLDRLAVSARELFGPPTMARVAGPARILAEARAGELARLGDDAAAAARRHGAAAERRRHSTLARLRLTLAPDAQGALDLSAVTADVHPAAVFPAAENGPTLAPVTVAGGLGPHKWADRRLLDHASAALNGAVPLIVDADGAVLEAERANVFLVQDGMLVTPPADGRILPGVARARVIEIARKSGIGVAERTIPLAALTSAEEAFLSGSIRGVEPLRGSRSDGAITARIGTKLRELWLASA
jgi:para-aminobenzoate synthetase / 4-amino-4-deoxychorismate lyase